MAVVKFINGKNEKIAGLVRAIDYVIDENKTEVFTLKGLEKNKIKEITQEDKESIFIEKLIEENKGKRIINYITKDEKTSKHLITGINCMPETAFDEMMVTKKMFRKETGRQFIHFTHSYHDKENITPELAHEISLKLIEQKRFKGFQIVAATHTDKNHIHTHFVLNTVNTETGRKWQQSNREREELIKYSNKLCAEYGLKYSFVNTKTNKFTMSSGEYRARKEGHSWKYELFLTINECMKTSTSKEEFIRNMEVLGYKVKWEESRKYITFTLPDGKRCRNNKLYPPEKFTKEAMEKRFELNKQFAEKKQSQSIKKENRIRQSQIHAKQNLILETIRMLENHPERGDKNYPLTYLEGQALKEKMVEQAKGEGLDWEKER